MSNRSLLVVAAMLLALLVYVFFPRRQERLGNEKYPVTGTVLVNGQPAEGVLVQFFGLDTGLSDQDSHPVGTTNAEGKFKLTSYRIGDGAVASKFSVAFHWPTNPLVPHIDRLQGKFRNYKTSKYQVTITPETRELEPFQLMINSKDLLPAETTATQTGGQEATAKP